MTPLRCLPCLLLLTLAACGDDGPAGSADGGADARVATCDPASLPTFETGDPDGHPEPLGASAEEARAGRVEAGELPPNPDGLMAWEAGDFLLANDRIAVLIEDAGVSDGYDPYGGKLVGVFLVEDGALARPADFNEVIITTVEYTFEPDRVTVLNDGSDGEAAVVRATGQLAELPFIHPLIDGFFDGDFEGMAFAADYRLEPGAEHVDITYRWISQSPRPETVRQAPHFFMQFEWMPPWARGDGFAFSEGSGVTEYVAFVDDDAASYLWSSPGSELEPLLEVSGAQLFGAPEFTLEPCGLTERHTVRMYVGPGLDGVLSARARTEGIEQRAITATVLEADASPAAGVRVHATDAEGTHLTRAMVGADGSAVLHVPADQAVELTAFRHGDPVVGPVPVAADGTDAELTMAERAFLHVTVTSPGPGGGAPVPARVQVMSDDPPSVPSSFGEKRAPYGRMHVEFAVDGDVTLPVPAGAHTVLVSRGYEYELVSTDVSVAAGETAEVPVALERVVDTTDVMCGDFHIHTRRSPDAPDPAEHKLAGAMADGLEIPVRTDHDWIFEFEETIADMGAGRWIYGVTGLELTTFSWGHFNVFPLDPLPEQRNHGAFDWFGDLPPETFGEVRARDTSTGRPALIINHPRDTGALAGIGAYFTAAGYDPETGSVDRPDYWDEEFQLVEVFNSDSFDEVYDPTDETIQVAEDWFSLLNSGRRVFAVGSSDSHHIRTKPVGYPRTCIRVGTDDAEVLRAMGPAHVRDIMLDGDFTVSGGIYVDALAAGGVGPGGTVEGAGATELVTVTVQAASWIAADTLRVFVDGALVETIALDETTVSPSNPVLRFQEEVMVPVADGAAGSWVVFVASGPGDLAPVHPGRDPFGVTNPIFFTR